MKTRIEIILTAAFALAALACQTAVTPVGNMRQQTPAATPAGAGADDSAEKLESVRQQDFQFVYVFRRRDGAPLETEDKKFLRANSPPETNQWIVTADGRAAIAGTNYQFPPASLETLKTRFAFEDNSPLKDEAPPAANTNAGNN